MAVYHFTLMDLGSKEIYSFIYDESQGKKCIFLLHFGQYLHFVQIASVEVASCLYKFIKEMVPESIRRIHIYQDNTPAQSKNRYVINSLFHALWKADGFLEQIELRFLGRSEILYF